MMGSTGAVGAGAGLVASLKDGGLSFGSASTDPALGRVFDPRGLRWVRLDDLRQGLEISCIDGRHAGCVLGAPGGNAGELVLMLSVVEWYLDEPLSDAVVEELLVTVAGELRAFYMHTDTDALGRLAETLTNDSRFDGALNGGVEALVRKPPLALQGALLEHLLRPDHTGCGHLGLLLRDPDTYRTRLGLAESVIGAFFRLLWRGSAMAQWVVLDGRHDETALLAFHTRQPLSDDLLVPSFCHDTEGAQVFVNHVPALRYVRNAALAKLMGSGAHPGLEALDRESVLMEVERLSERQLQATLGTLAPGVPRVRVTF